MAVRTVGVLVALACLALMVQVTSGAGAALPAEPDENTRVEELFDNEARLYLLLYSLSGDGRVDYVTGRRVHEQARSEFGNPVYYAARYPQFYWWNHTLWLDPDQDGLNGNEVVYQENVEFDRSRYKPCQFNGQAC
jgi:hypothetical protein